MTAVVRAAREAGATGIWARTCCTCGPAPASTSWRTWRATGPTCSPTTSGCTPAARTGKRELDQVRRQVSELRHRYDLRDRRTVKLEAERAADGPMQLELPLAPGLAPEGITPGWRAA